MANKRPFRWKNGLISAIVLVGVFFVIASVYSKTDVADMRPDILMIDLPAIPGGEKMPGVQFLHDAHTAGIQEKNNCLTCHLEKEKQLVFKFKRLENSSTEADMAIYHDNCIACHEETEAAGKKSGPVSGDCRSCHKTDLTMSSSRQPIPFDKSLHYRHEAAGVIKATDPKDSNNCSACHHSYDDAAQKKFYKKGDEGSCRYCHLQTSTKEAASIRMASHQACVNCHQTLVVQKKTAGPVECTGCHDLDAQKMVKKVSPVPRMKRNQPDVALMASWMTGQQGDAKNVVKQMEPVPFNHKVHEMANDTCRSCHHQTLKKCSDCHTESGGQDGGFVQLAQAMHTSASNQSCIGCHSAAQQAQNCAGCHISMPDKAFAEQECSLCHRIDRQTLGPWPMSQESKNDIAAAAFAESGDDDTKITDDQIPEKVVINVLEDKYEGAQFPHRQIFRSLESRIADHRMAGHFHTQPTTLCSGCHHNSPASLQPPKCASCHGDAFKGSPDGRPGLMGAYHGQCIKCHQVMDIKEPAATDCGKCHKEKVSSK